MSPHNVQVVFELEFLDPPQSAIAEMENDEEREKLSKAPRQITVAMCIPEGYALLENNSSDNDAYRFASPLAMKSTLNALLLNVSPVYSVWFEWRMMEKMKQIADEQAKEEN